MIEIVIKPAEKLPGIENIFLKFSYYNPKLIDIARSFSERKYNEKTKTWEIPYYKLKDLFRLYKNEIIHIKYTKPKSNEIVEIPKDYKFVNTPFPHQLEGIKFLINKENSLLADEQGLGKTFQSLVATDIRMRSGQVDKCLILCGVNSLKFNWSKEIEEHLGKDSIILGLRKRKTKDVYYMGSTEDKIEDLKTTDKKYLITNVETLIVDKFVEELKKRKDINMIILDECHKCTINTSSQRGSNLQKLSDKPYKIALSGTPVLNAPTDSYGVLKWLGYEKANKSDFYGFYCNYGGFNDSEIVSYKNLHIMKQILNTCMLRRLKEEVLDLPPKILTPEYLEMGRNQQEIYDEMRDDVLRNIDLIVESKNPLSKLIRLRQATNYTGTLSSKIQESIKLERIKDYVREVKANGKKCLIFSNWTTMTDEIIKALSEYNPAIMTGQQSEIENESEKNRFRSDKDCCVVVGTIGTMGTGHTLNSFIEECQVSLVLFTDLPWNKGTLDQCTDRVHRIGTKGTINVMFLICKNTIDERIYEIVCKKGIMAETLLNNASPEDRKQMILELIS